MLKIIIFFLFIAALSLFVTAELILWLALPFLPGIVFKLGGLMLLGALGLLFLAGVFGALKNIARSVRLYFSRSQRLQRRLLFVQCKQDRVERLIDFRKRHIQFFHELKIKRLHTANDRKHLRALSKTVYKDLRARKKNLPSPVFREWREEYTASLRNRDGAALLKLQQKIADWA